MITKLLSSVLTLALASLNISNLLAKTPEQPYSEIRTIGSVEVRFYPKAIMATVSGDGTSYTGSSNQLFGKLAGYIFGSNDKKEKIAMTAPVYMEAGQGKSSMTFVMPENYQLGTLPKPNSGDVKIHESEDEYVAVLRFSGYASEKEILQKKAELETALKAAGIKHLGYFRYLGYNAPWDFINRRNEVMFRIKKEDALKGK
jgi:SOUL heme-binding protein